ncbi:Pkinase-domain-containing protein [Hesseltinella vesiculosa]|uniref:Pkinase-domain-containing protein n=1 Tax=Hesseltinella vesiculosa TaxID=101127 RepID=A0A1X2GRB7_9FUNG|nr:Pkinase-domain-containing protein [Hesseltinella vesiculosa]
MIKNGSPHDDYRFLNVIGAGSFGSVHQAVHKTTHQHVAVKIMKRKFDTAEECDQLLECKIIRLIPTHIHIVQTLDIYFTPTHELCFIMEHMDGGNLYQWIKQKRDANTCFSPTELRDIMRQTLQAVAHIHANQIFHRDLKPENLLITYTTGHPVIKLADFGLAKETSSHPPYTEYVSTRWYRAPEVLLRSNNYSSAVDQWAIGTIFAELIRKQPLFPGESEIDQLFRICKVLGSPGNKYVSTRKKVRVDDRRASPGFARRKAEDKQPASTASTLSTQDGGGEWREGVKLAHRIGFEFPFLTPQPLATVIPEATPIMLDLLRQFLFFNPNQRLKADEALQHDFFREGNDLPPPPLLQPTPIAANAGIVGKRRQLSIDGDPMEDVKVRKREPSPAPPTILPLVSGMMDSDTPNESDDHAPSTDSMIDKNEDLSWLRVL